MAGVGLDRVQGNEQLVADLLVRITLGNQLQHRQFTGAELVIAAAVLFMMRFAGRQ
ncbi:hypothetical protein D3C76_1841760 [compost metagenome]